MRAGRRFVIERNPALPRIVADLKTIPAYATACSVEWTAAVKNLPPGVKLSDLVPIDFGRANEIVDGRGVPSRSEAAAIDNALGTNASRHLPKPGSASMAQKAIKSTKITFVDSAPRAPRYLPSARKSKPSQPSKTSTESKALKALRSEGVTIAKPGTNAETRAAAWRDRHLRSGLSMPKIAELAKIPYERVKRVLRRGVPPKPGEVEALERVLGRA
jgi:hypothetical protein